MQCIRQALVKRPSTFICQGRPSLRSFYAFHTASIAKAKKDECYSPDSKRILEEYMIPGPYLKFFEISKKNNDGSTSWHNTPKQIIRSIPARPVSYNEFDTSPTIAQERFAHRINRAIATTFAIELMPSKWLNTNYLIIRNIKVSRNLKKCHILYTLTSVKKKERENVHSALKTWTKALSAMIRNNAQLKYPISVKFVPDTETVELESVLKKIEAEENQH
ncbi:hypothetical protein BDF20DRAFT_916383 [Mycotypha africana]|uniref:uncharacterized protein n=1 Tax=Mycotypha africana TaxID=64632 RepID=UPI002301A394|nr:uncharacterized protein BDF20DRAFT_916383 [Mycotypha africana]KAI8968961.1 hypothetical protein BDF20DRAFT_916383 [Mycotypha africana]